MLIILSEVTIFKFHYFPLFFASLFFRQYLYKHASQKQVKFDIVSLESF